jgi:hypothetical protein
MIRERDYCRNIAVSLIIGSMRAIATDHSASLVVIVIIVQDPPFSDLLPLECHEQEVKPPRATVDHYLAAIASRSPTCWRHIA